MNYHNQIADIENNFKMTKDKNNNDDDDDGDEKKESGKDKARD